MNISFFKRGLPTKAPSYEKGSDCFLLFAAGDITKKSVAFIIGTGGKI
jgi:hypothetical protein